MPQPSSNSGYSRDDFNRTRKQYYNSIRSPVSSVNSTVSSNASKIHDKFCPFDGRRLEFDRMARRDYFCPQCGYIPSREEMGINIKDIGITTVDGRVMGNSLYGTDEIPTNILVPSGHSRSRQNNKKMELSRDDQLLKKQGYTIIKTEERIPQGNFLTKFKQRDSEDYDILDRYRRSMGGLQ